MVFEFGVFCSILHLKSHIIEIKIEIYGGSVAIIEIHNLHKI